MRMVTCCCDTVSTISCLLAYMGSALTNLQHSRPNSFLILRSFLSTTFLALLADALRCSSSGSSLSQKHVNSNCWLSHSFTFSLMVSLFWLSRINSSGEQRLGVFKDASCLFNSSSFCPWFPKRCSFLTRTLSTKLSILEAKDGKENTWRDTSNPFLRFFSTFIACLALLRLANWASAAMIPSSPETHLRRVKREVKFPDK